MSTLEDLRIEAGLSVSELARQSGVSRFTIEKAEQDEPIRGNLAGKICQILSEHLRRKVSYKEANIRIL